MSEPRSTSAYHWYTRPSQISHPRGRRNRSQLVFAASTHFKVTFRNRRLLASDVKFSAFLTCFQPWRTDEQIWSRSGRLWQRRNHRGVSDEETHSLIRRPTVRDVPPTHLYYQFKSSIEQQVLLYDNIFDESPTCSLHVIRQQMISRLLLVSSGVEVQQDVLPGSLRASVRAGTNIDRPALRILRNRYLHCIPIKSQNEARGIASYFESQSLTSIKSEIG